LGEILKMANVKFDKKTFEKEIGKFRKKLLYLELPLKVLMKKILN